MESVKAKICVPVCVRRVSELIDAAERAAAVADFLELRLDYLDPKELKQLTSNEYAALRKAAARPVVITYRPAEQGGDRAIDVADRLSFWLFNSEFWIDQERRAPDFADVELDLLGSDYVREQLARHRIICSHHDFVGVPSDLLRIYERLLSTAAPILKLTVTADDATDCLPVFKVLERARSDDREMIAIAMGQAGVMTRILGPSRGSFLTYGSLDEDHASAPGQITARALREVYRIDRIDAETGIVGVIGRPVAHSISPHIHNAAFAEANINAVFIPLEVHDLDAFVRRMVRPSSREIEWNLRGLSVTAPHKTTVMKHLDWIDPAAKEIGAINTIVLEKGELHGYNTDAVGFIAPLKSRIESLGSVQCAVIGAGGAARAVVWALRNQGARVTVFSRNCDRAQGLIDNFGVECRSLASATFGQFEVVVNATPLGTRGTTETETAATLGQLRGVRLAYDLVYNPLETRFLQEARTAGCETIGGLEMLIGQAVEQFKLWTGIEPSGQAMRRAAVGALH